MILIQAFHPAVQEVTEELMSLSPDGDPLQYDVQIDDQCFSGLYIIDYESGWI
jgi:hypothetical protein